MWVLSAGLSMQYQHTRPRKPDPVLGRVHLLRASNVYVTNAERLLLNVMSFGGWGSVLIRVTMVLHADGKMGQIGRGPR